METGFLPRDRFQELLDTLRRLGFRCIGPQVRDGAILYAPVSSVDELPRGASDIQVPGMYRINQTLSPRYFGWANGPQALKPIAFAPHEVLWRARRKADGDIEFRSEPATAGQLAVIGVRACDLAALALQDLHFLGAVGSDSHYAARRAQLLLIAVHCSDPSDACFCVSTGDGPRASSGFDLALAELDSGFIVESNGSRGAAVAAELRLEAVTGVMRAEAAQQVNVARVRQRRRLPGRELSSVLSASLEHPRWTEVAARCLSCGNCTSVCPTCFCHARVESPVLGGGESAHARVWDSCFSQGHSYIYGITVRGDTRTRYRQWLTHKLGSWHDQFGRSGCVGCGRCISWCPVGIDITEEAAVVCAGTECE